ncbi:MAG: hypothetical protein KIS77_00085 [Saprospiraceae bacterium]|nr:hypothetical protein [Saprospiraceae bacterium]
MEVLQQKLTCLKFPEMEFDDNDTHHRYELVNGELGQKQSPPFDPQRISRKSVVVVYGLAGQRYKLTAYQEEPGILKTAALEGLELGVEKKFA